MNQGTQEDEPNSSDDEVGIITFTTNTSQGEQEEGHRLSNIRRGRSHNTTRNQPKVGSNIDYLESHNLRNRGGTFKQEHDDQNDDHTNNVNKECNAKNKERESRSQSSDRKKLIEKKRRQGITEALESLSMLLLKIDSSNLIKQNNIIYYSSKKHKQHHNMIGSGEKYPGALITGGSGEHDHHQNGLNRTAIINHTAKLMEKLEMEGKELKQQLANLHAELQQRNGKTGEGKDKTTTTTSIQLVHAHRGPNKNISAVSSPPTQTSTVSPQSPQPAPQNDVENKAYQQQRIVVEPHQYHAYHQQMPHQTMMVMFPSGSTAAGPVPSTSFICPPSSTAPVTFTTTGNPTGQVVTTTQPQHWALSPHQKQFNTGAVTSFSLAAPPQTARTTSTSVSVPVPVYMSPHPASFPAGSLVSNNNNTSSFSTNPIYASSAGPSAVTKAFMVNSAFSFPRHHPSSSLEGNSNGLAAAPSSSIEPRSSSSPTVDDQTIYLTQQRLQATNKFTDNFFTPASSSQ
mmetsp:Transcript_18735/g.22966  ORF Transcript_18735/g.22966 Transcript_18735/m.22966 type:complete len:513 (+) Transcript_18735:185-1723(+)